MSRLAWRAPLCSIIPVPFLCYYNFTKDMYVSSSRDKRVYKTFRALRRLCNLFRISEIGVDQRKITSYDQDHSN